MEVMTALTGLSKLSSKKAGSKQHVVARAFREHFVPVLQAQVLPPYMVKVAPKAEAYDTLPPCIRVVAGPREPVPACVTLMDALLTPAAPADADARTLLGLDGGPWLDSATHALRARALDEFTWTASLLTS